MLTKLDQLEYDCVFAEKLKKQFHKYGSDKPNHAYEKAYQHFLSKINKIDNILELGIANYTIMDGNSLNAWSSLYPESKIYGLDHDSEKMICSGNIKTFLADQETITEQKMFDIFGSMVFQIIIDDASHEMNNTRQTFKALFNKLSNDGFYFIEDIRRVSNNKQQTVEDIENYLRYIPGIGYTIVDLKPGEPDDNDSIIACIWRTNG